VPGSSRDSTGSRGGTTTAAASRMGQGFQLRETASFLNGLPPEVFGMPHLKILHIFLPGLRFRIHIGKEADLSIRIVPVLSFRKSLIKKKLPFPLFRLFSRE
jgi:hypothetical protein